MLVLVLRTNPEAGAANTDADADAPPPPPPPDLVGLHLGPEWDGGTPSRHRDVWLARAWGAVEGADSGLQEGLELVTTTHRS